MKQTKFLGILGVLAAVLVGVGEFLLHYSPNVLNNPEAYSFFQYVSLNNLKTGHFLSVLGLPFYFAGYLHIYKMLQSGSETFARLVLSFGFLAFSVGGIWIGSRAMIGNIVHLKGNMPIETYTILLEKYTNLYEVLVQILRVVIALLSIFFSYTILKFKTNYPKWMAYFNPITVLILFVIMGFAIPFIGKYTLPILMNVTHLVIFSVSLYALKIKGRNL